MSRPYISVEVARRVREAAQNRCGYCLSPQRLVMARLEIEHLIPVSKGGSSEESNLWLACPICNGYKADKTEAIDPETNESAPLFNARSQIWSEHFCWIENGLKMQGLTPSGRATIVALKLNDDPDVLTVRSYWILAGWHPPEL